MSHKHCTPRERGCELASLSAHVFSTTFSLGFTEAIDQAERELDGLLTFADAWDEMAYACRQQAELEDSWAASLLEAEGAS